MKTLNPIPPRIAIACGGTGGHLYPGLAVAERLLEMGAEVTLLVSAKTVDERALQTERRFRVVVLPAVGLSVRHLLRFLLRTWKSYRVAREEFRGASPAAYLSMGGFTSAAPARAARGVGAAVVFHEANAIPGRANRWLARRARCGFVYFPEAAEGLRRCEVRTVGMPVRDRFQVTEAASCRWSLGLAPERPVLLVMGGSQGASGVNEIALAAVPRLASLIGGLQVLHLAGGSDEKRVREAYREARVSAVVRPFLTEMELALGAADVAMARAGASSLAEMAAMRLPPVLIPYPHAADDHQMANARAFERSGAARVLAQAEATPDRVVEVLVPLFQDESQREAMRAGLATWHRPDADRVLAGELWRLAGGTDEGAGTLGGDAESATRREVA